MKVKIRTKYQRAHFASNLARQLQTHSDRKVAAIADAIVYALSAPVELVNRKIAECSVIAPEIVAALEDEEAKGL